MSLPDPRKLTAQRIARTEAYAAKIQRMFSQTVNDLLALPISKADVSNGNMFSFDAETDRVQRQVEQLLRRLQAAATLAIQKGVTLEWEQANQAADAILKSQFSKKALASSYMKGWNARNLEAMQQFLNRSDMGMNLSQRVWQSCRQLRDEMEVALTVSIGEGEDAGTISRRVRQYLNDPDLMFRRFRYKDEDGRWQTKWKKRIKDPDRPGKYRFIDYDKDSYKDQWTGKGYYKSSAKNAMRVARTETNIAYRRADHERWQGLDFVLGQRVVLSKNHPEVDICDKLSAPNQREYDADDKRGLYPKDFVFDGWHPQCFCFVIPVMVAPEEMAKMNEAFVKGEDYTPKGEQVTEYPEEFQKWVKANKKKIEEAQKRGTEPYFIRNNAEAVEEIINPNRKAENEKALIDKFANLLRTNDWSTDNEQAYQLMEQWEGMSIEQRIKTLEKSELSGLVPDDFFDEESCFVDIYKPVSKDYILDYADEVLRNIADGFDMSDVDAYVAFYNDGTILWTGEMDFSGALDGKRKLPRTGLIAAMTNGGVLDNIYWAKNAKGMEAIKKYTGYKTVEKGKIINEDKYIGQPIVEKIQDKIIDRKYAKSKTLDEISSLLSHSLEKNLGYKVEIQFDEKLTDLDTVKAQATEIERLTRRYNLQQSSLGKIIFGYKPENEFEFGSVYYNHDKNEPKILRLTSSYDSRLSDMAISNSRCDKSRIPIAVTTHEFGHLLYQIRYNATSDLKIFEEQVISIYEEYKMEFKKLTQNREFDKRAEIFIGVYGDKTINDFLAESFQEYMNCKHPSPYALRIGKLIDTWFRH